MITIINSAQICTCQNGFRQLFYSPGLTESLWSRTRTMFYQFIDLQSIQSFQLSKYLRKYQIMLPYTCGIVCVF